MKHLRFGRSSLLAALVAALGACENTTGVTPLAPSEFGASSMGSTAKAPGGGPRQAAPKIAYSLAGADRRIYTISESGQDVKPLQNTEGGTDPAWSPNRQKLAFAIHSGPAAGIYVIKPNGTQRVRVYSGPAYSPAWSPDGSRLAFHARVGANYQILTVRSDGTGGLQQATSVGGNMYPSWSPDGTRLAFYSARPAGEGIWVMKVQSGAAAIIAHCWDCNSPEWSPVVGDERIAYSVQETFGIDTHYVMIVNSDGSNPRQLLYSHQHGTHDLRPSWSPDATKLLINSAMFGSQELVVVDTDGSNAKPLAVLPGPQAAPAWAR